MVQVDVRRYQITCNSVHVALHSAVALPRTSCGGSSVAVVFPAGLETQLYLFQLSVKKLFLKRVKDEQWNVQKTSKAYVFFVTLELRMSKQQRDAMAEYSQVKRVVIIMLSFLTEYFRLSSAYLFYLSCTVSHRKCV